MQVNFFGFDVTKDAGAEEIAGSAFQVRTLSEGMRAEIDAAREKLDQLEEQSSLPTSLGIVKTFSGLAFFLILGSTLNAGIVKAFQNAWWLELIGLACLILWIVLTVKTWKLQKNVKMPEHFQEQMEDTLRRARQELWATENVDALLENAVNFDILAEVYVVKNDKPVRKNMGLTMYNNMEVCAYVEAGMLYLSDVETLWGIPTASLRSITLVKKRVSFPEWNKTEPYNAACYKPFKITTNSYGHYFSRYYKVEICDVKGEFYLLIPEYDGETFMQLTKLRPADSD